MAVLVLLCAGAIVAAVLVVGPKSAPAARSRTVTAQRGVVESTVSGSGTIEAKQTDVDFAQSGQLQEVEVHEGQHVAEGQELAKEKPGDQQLSLEQAQANLRSAQAKLQQAQAQAASGTSQSSSQSQAAASGPTGTTGPSGQSENQASSAATQASNAANIASAQAGVDSAQAAVDSAEQAVSDTTLTAPVSGTVATVSAVAGDFVSGGGSSNASSSSSSGGTGSTGGNGNGNVNGSTNGSNASSSQSSGANAFIVIVDMSRLELVVPFSESDIHRIKLHQPATVSVNALPETKLAAHVTAIDTLPTSNSGVVSYDVTFKLDQRERGLKPGMTASASVVVERVENAVNVASAAISGSGAAASVTLADGSSRRVTTGIAGDSTTEVLTGLRAGEEVRVPIATGSSSGGGASLFGNRGAGALGRGLGGGGAFPGAGGARLGGGGGGGGGAIAAPPGAGP